MDNPNERIQLLQEIQMQIARQIDEYRGKEEYRELVYQLREAFSNLNQAKVLLADMAMAAGTMTMHHPDEKKVQES